MESDALSAALSQTLGVDSCLYPDRAVSAAMEIVESEQRGVRGEGRGK